MRSGSNRPSGSPSGDARTLSGSEARAAGADPSRSGADDERTTTRPARPSLRRVSSGPCRQPDGHGRYLLGRGCQEALHLAGGVVDDDLVAPGLELVEDVTHGEYPDDALPRCPTGAPSPGMLDTADPQYSSIAQLAEQPAVNRQVLGSSPSRGATEPPGPSAWGFFCVRWRGRWVRPVALRADRAVGHAGGRDLPAGPPPPGRCPVGGGTIIGERRWAREPT
jgi:hypothetical protein